MYAALLKGKIRKRSRLPQVRPSVLEQCLRGDPWVSLCTHPGLLVLFLNNQPVNLIAGTALEQASLNQILFTLHHRFPRKK